ncbi:phosphoribosylanthranilate isomerase [Salinisphaera sp. T31B1]|uniref:phosphoribosylanthranilate isomerase n=1 Tax=Salinisphaera sp. T31B1 TaxID=727963 RepID=UPI00333FD634
MQRVRVKICGVTRPEDGLAAARAGADAVGLVFYPASSRAVSIEQARDIAAALPPFVARVALFLDASADEVTRVVEALRLDALQFHGHESAAFCRRFGLPYLKSVPMGEPDIDPGQWARAYDDAQGLLLDANRAGQAGGRGETFDWHTRHDLPDRPIVVAGGLNVDNVGDAIRRFAPYAVDTSSGVESAPGIKDAQRMQDFVRAVYNTTG